MIMLLQIVIIGISTPQGYNTQIVGIDIKSVNTCIVELEKSINDYQQFLSNGTTTNLEEQILLFETMKRTLETVKSIWVFVKRISWIIIFLIIFLFIEVILNMIYNNRENYISIKNILEDLIEKLKKHEKDLYKVINMIENGDEKEIHRIIEIIKNESNKEKER